ncbi:MAG: glycosyl transferase [Burkholderiales bacterium]|nr:glycosyl transferase [Burkholderiales bacterium]
MTLAAPALAALAAVVAALAAALLLRWRGALPVAVPNDRTLHVAPLPRVGGLAIWAGLAPVVWLAPALPAMRIALWAPAWLLLFAVSLRDDVKSVAIGARLAVHAIAATWFAVALFAGTGVAPAWIALAALAVAWSLNLYNFMDGSDGLAAAMAVIGFGAYGAALALRGEPSALPLCVAAATVPVLVVNLPPARMFLGDVGAVPLGFLAAALGLGGIAADAWSAWFPILVFLPFVADATATLARRVLARERFWQPHRAHYYQRLHRLGAGHAGTLAAYAVLMLGCAASAVACAWAAPQWGVLALTAWCAVHAGFFAAIDYHWRRGAPS